MFFPVDAQSNKNGEQECQVVSFFAGKKVAVPFDQSPRFPGVSGTARIELSDRRTSKIEAEFKRLPSVLDIGGKFSIYVLWAVLPDGSMQKLGALETSGEKVSDASFNDEDALTEFGLLLTAEPHHLVSAPGLIVLRSGAPTGDNSKMAKSHPVRCGSSGNDYLGTAPKFANDKDRKNYYRKPLTLFGAEYALALANDAGAETAAPEAYDRARTAVRDVEELWGSKGNEKEIERDANTAIGYAAEAERQAINKRRAEKENQKQQQINETLADYKDELRKAQQARDTYKEQLEKRTRDADVLQTRYLEEKAQNSKYSQANADLTEEVKQLRSENFDLTVKTSKLETDVFILKGAKAFVSELPTLAENFSILGRTQIRANTLWVTLPETIWEQADQGILTDKIKRDMEPPFRKIGDRKYLEVQISSYVTAGEDSSASDKMAQKWAAGIVQQFLSAGVEGRRIKTESNLQRPTASPSKKGAVMAPNRIEIVVRLISNTSF